MAAVLVWSTPLVRRIWRFRLVLFLVRMWRLYAPARLMLPLPRTRKRFAAPRLDFIFGIKTSFSLTPGGSLRERLKPRLSLVARYAAAGFAAGAFFDSGFGFAAAFLSGAAFFFGASTITICR